MPAVTRAAARRGESVIPPYSMTSLIVAAVGVPQTPVPVPVPQTVPFVADTPTPPSPPTLTAPRTRINQPLSRENTIEQVTVSATGQGTHTRWIRPCTESSSVDALAADLITTRGTRTGMEIVNAYAIPLSLPADPFHTPAPQPQPTTPPRIERVYNEVGHRHLHGQGQGIRVGVGHIHARRILDPASGESFYEVVLPSHAFRGLVQAAGAGAGGADGGVGCGGESGYGGGNGSAPAPAPGSMETPLMPRSNTSLQGMQMQLQHESLGSPFHSGGSNALNFPRPPATGPGPVAHGTTTSTGTETAKPLAAQGSQTRFFSGTPVACTHGRVAVAPLCGRGHVGRDGTPSPCRRGLSLGAGESGTKMRMRMRMRAGAGTGTGTPRRTRDDVN